MTDAGVPDTGAAVYDSGSCRVGLVMGRQGPYLQLRPLGGGREWDANPAHVRPATRDEFLSAQLAEVNARSRHKGY
ncbi:MULTISPECIES: hypothetical protein [Streptomyces]|uniref:WGR domain-containing protein n=1 Tax=Streptomyces mutomycini TaxID=284036 RepID=A0ABW0B128_9ACTN|nr:MULTISPECIES: hypothetical protein [Streptomyces]KPC78367.1 hypothetical protein ADK82_30515 [Streptomyces sp. NRRL S-4]